jgi:hypothetical protein
MSEYTFFNNGRIGADNVDNTQRNMENTRYSSYVLSNYFAEPAENSHVNFATEQPNVMFSGAMNGPGLIGGLVDMDSNLVYKSQQERSLEKLSLNQRPFLTVPYLGKGPFDPTAESQLQQTDSFSNNKKSVNTISEISYIPITNYPLIPSIQDTVTNPAYLVEGVAMDGWVRGGASSRKQG